MEKCGASHHIPCVSAIAQIDGFVLYIPSMPISSTRLKIAVSVVVAALVLGLGGWWLLENSGSPRFDSTYQAVLLSNGQVYFGRLEGLNTQFPVLREVYYVQSGVDQQTKEQKNILLKRGSEWHAPDRMVLNKSQIVLVEPVGPNSRVAELISELKRK